VIEACEVYSKLVKVLDQFIWFDVQILVISCMNTKWSNAHGFLSVYLLSQFSMNSHALSSFLVGVRQRLPMLTMSLWQLGHTPCPLRDLRQVQQT
jgi:hypothetical protein